jgi:hypothetical protein
MAPFHPNGKKLPYFVGSIVLTVLPVLILVQCNLRIRNSVTTGVKPKLKKVCVNLLINIFCHQMLMGRQKLHCRIIFVGYKCNKENATWLMKEMLWLCWSVVVSLKCDRWIMLKRLVFYIIPHVKDNLLCFFSDCRLLAVDCRLSVVGCRLSVVGCRLLAVGCLLLAVGCWLSVVCCWL